MADEDIEANHEEKERVVEEKQVVDEVTPPENTWSTILKYVSLVVLVFQYTSFTLTVRYSRTVRRSGDEMYITSTVVVFNELFKLTTCLLITLIEKRSISRWVRMLYDDVIADPKTTLKVGVPAFIYVIQNNLPYIAMSHIDAATFQVTYQLRVLTTALFAVLMLGKKLSKTQWFSLVLLFIGLALVQLQPTVITQMNSITKDGQNPIIGLMAVVVGAMCSGFAGVYFEKILKGSSNRGKSIWLRNIQLGLFGFIIGLVGMITKDGAAVREKGILHGYNTLVWSIICIQAFGGLLVAVVIKYADNILKGFATSCSLVLACVFSVFLFDFIITIQFAVGSFFVIGAVFLYSWPRSV